MKSEIKCGVLVIYLTGKVIGIRDNDPLPDLINNSIEAGKSKFLFNLSEVKLMDSTGLGVLLNTVTKTRSAGGLMALCNVPRQLKELSRITQLNGFFNEQPDEDSALSFLTQ